MVTQCQNVRNGHESVLSRKEVLLWNGCRLCVQLCDWKTLFNSCGFIRCRTLNAVLWLPYTNPSRLLQVGVHSRSFGFYQAALRGPFHSGRHWFHAGCLRWFFLKKDGNLGRSVWESRCCQRCSDWLRVSRKRTGSGGNLYLSHRTGPVLFLFTKWT